MSAVKKLIRFSSVSWCSALCAILAVSLILGSFPFVGDAHAANHHTSSSVSHDGDPAKDDHSDGGLALTHCGVPSCSPTNVSLSSCERGPMRTSVSHNLLIGNDILLQPLLLECDPPVPRGEFFQA